MRVTTLARRLGAVALVAALTACGGGGDTDTATDTADPTSEASTDAPEGEEAETEEPEAGEGGLQELDAETFYPALMAAMMEAETFTIESTTDSEGQTQTMTGEARYGEDSMAMKATMSGAQPMEMILLDQKMYMKGGGITTDGKWFVADLTDEDSLFGMLGKSMDPQIIFGAAQKPKSVELLGQEDVDGVATNHYRVTSDPAVYVEALELPEEALQTLPDEIAVDLWLDEDDLPRKFEQTTTVPNVATGEELTSHVEGFYSNFGEPVDIKAPAKNEISPEDPFGGML